MTIADPVFVSVVPNLNFDECFLFRNNLVENTIMMFPGFQKDC